MTSPINMQLVTDHLSQGIDSESGEISTLLDNLDPTDQGQVLQLSAKIQSETAMYQLESTLIKSLMDSIKSIINSMK